MKRMKLIFIHLQRSFGGDAELVTQLSRNQSYIKEVLEQETSEEEKF